LANRSTTVAVPVTDANQISSVQQNHKKASWQPDVAAGSLSEKEPTDFRIGFYDGLEFFRYYYGRTSIVQKPKFDFFCY